MSQEFMNNTKLYIESNNKIKELELALETERKNNLELEKKLNKHIDDNSKTGINNKNVFDNITPEYILNKNKTMIGELECNIPTRCRESNKSLKWQTTTKYIPNNNLFIDLIEKEKEKEEDNKSNENNENKEFNVEGYDGMNDLYEYIDGSDETQNSDTIHNQNYSFINNTSGCFVLSEEANEIKKENTLYCENKDIELDIEEFGNIDKVDYETIENDQEINKEENTISTFEDFMKYNSNTLPVLKSIPVSVVFENK